MSELLPVEYFHVVFTLPESFNSLALHNKRVVYDLLFRAASQTLIRIAADPKHLGVEIGFTAVLHTWGQTLLLHPHLHCIVAGGGLQDGRWVSSREGFFLPVKVLSRLFRGLFLNHLKRAYDDAKLDFYGSIEQLAEPAAFSNLLLEAAKTEWVVYAKRPFGGPAQVLEYLGRYTHRVAISNNRLLKSESGQVAFTWKDYRDRDAVKQMTLDAEEFIRRFLLHILPDGFQRIRHFGFLSNRNKKEKLDLCRKSLGVDSQSQSKQPSDWKSRYEELTGVSLDACPVCGKGRMIAIEIFNPLRFSPIIEGIDSS